MELARKQSEPLRAQLGLWDAVSIIVGIVIGAGIYETPPMIFKNVSTAWMGLAVWGIGGLLSLVGALCYAELASTYPRSGGDYVYLSRAFGPWMGLLFGWAQLVVIRTGNVGMMAYVFADYAVRLWKPFESGSAFIYAVSAVLVLSFVNILGVVFGKGTQNVLTAAKVLGLGGILVAGFFAPQPLAVTPAKPLATEPSFAFAMILVLYTYGGWNDAALVAAEQRNPKRNIPLALILGTSAITLIYLLVNAAYLFGLGFEGARQSNAIAADVVERFLKEDASKAWCLLVMISALGAMNGTIFTGSRVYSRLGSEYSLFAWLGQWQPGRGSPLWSLVTQMAITIGMIAAVGTDAGRGQINFLLAKIGFDPVQWEGHGGFDTLLRCTAPVFWLFFLWTGLSLFVLRQKDPKIERPFCVPLYPLLPIIFCDTCAYMLFSATAYAGKLALLAFALLHAGLLFYWLSKRRVTSEEQGVSELPA